MSASENPAGEAVPTAADPTPAAAAGAGSAVPATASHPIIGITTYLEQSQTGVWDVPASFLPKVYIDGVTEAGGTAVLLPPQPVDAEAAAAIVDRLDGIVLSGGADVSPALYGQEPHQATGAPRADRDDFETALMNAVIAADLPFLGICRGAQVLNVTLGGDLIQHLPDVVGDTRYQLGGARFNPIDVTVEPGTQIARVLGESPRATAPLYHHQAIGRVAEPLTVTARTDDGIVEAVELGSATFGVAVQWHPEEVAEDRRLFVGLVEAARDYRRDRTADITSTEGQS